MIVTIANAATVSSTADLKGRTLCGIYLPAAFTGTTITFLASVDGTNFVPVHIGTASTLYTRTVVQNSFVPVDPTIFRGVRYVQLTVASQAAARTVTLAVTEK